MITFDEANQILSTKFPDKTDMVRFPLGKLLERLWDRPDEDGKEYQAHAPRVLEAMNKLLGKDPASALSANLSQEASDLLQETKGEISRIFGRLDSSAQAMFRITTLYHDIGKYIIKERHPTVGWFTLEYLEPSEKDALRSLLGNREDYLELMLILIRDHDQFGVLSTGEASYPILLRAMTSLGGSLDDQKRVLSAMMWFNLADMIGTPGLEVQRYDLDNLIEDWKWAIQLLDRGAQSRRNLDDLLIEEASSEALVQKRISRLLLEASRNVPKRLNELNRRIGNEPMVARLVRDQLATVYPTRIPRRGFGREFTHVCKLDYGKRFFADLVEYCEGEPPSEEKRSLASKRNLPLAAPNRVDSTDLVYAVLAILRRITSTYSAMINAGSDSGNLIGVEMKDLTPRNAPEKTARIIELLLKSHYPGLSWIMSDVPAWYF